MPELKLYTVKDLREWLMHNQSAEGLSEQVIAPTRAWAIIHNPYVKDDDAIVAAIFEDGQVAAYTASFPDVLEGQRIWWASTLYCYPQFAGRGYGMIVVGSLMEAHDPEWTYDRWGASETVEIFNHFGYLTTYTPRYHLSFKKIDASSIKGKLAYCAQEIKRGLHPWPKQSKANYALSYTSYIDGEAFEFMKAHRGMDLWLREQEMLNWMLRYPIKQGCIIPARVEKDLHFTSYSQSYAYRVVKVYDGELFVGVYILRQNGDTLSVVYLYYIDAYKEDIFASIVDHMTVIKPYEFVTENKELCAHVRDKIGYTNLQVVEASFSVPSGMKLPNNFLLQLGDGDSFI